MPCHRPLLLSLVPLVASWLQAQNRGEAEIALEGNYLGASSERLNDTSGLAFRFQDFFPRLGLLSGSLESFGHQGSLETGDNFLSLSGPTWGGLRWKVAGGDFRVLANVLESPFSNFYTPEVTARGVYVQASTSDHRYFFYWGGETLQDGPRIPFRISVPQTVLALGAERRLGERLRLSVRLMRLASNEQQISSQPSLFPPERRFRSVTSLSFQSTYKVGSNLNLYAETGVAGAERMESASAVKTVPFSTVVGPVWESTRFTLRANYVYQSLTYLPLLGYFAGDRRGPFAEGRYRPWKGLELYASASRSTNNLEHDASRADFRSTTDSAGVGLTLPWKLSANAQLSDVWLDTRQPGESAAARSDNRQITANLSRPVGRHSLRFSVRELKVATVPLRDNQRSAEIEDVVQLGTFLAGGAVRFQQEASTQQRNSLVFRGFGQVRFGRLSAHADVETGNDLANRTVFATNAYQTAAVGLSARLGAGWTLQMDALRNRLTMQLNPENVFALESQGVGVTGDIGGYEQWNLFFRLSRQFTWGGGLPHDNMEQFAAGVIPLVGSVEGLIRAHDGPVEGIAVALDNAKTATTDSYGHFRFPEVSEGVHKIGLAMRELPADFDPGPESELTIAVKPRGNIRVEMSVVRLMSLRGRIDETGGIAREDIIVRLLPTTRYTTPDAEGDFVFDNVREGDYAIALDPASVPQDVVVVGPSRVAVSLRRKEEPAPVHFQLEVRRPEKPIRRLFELAPPEPHAAPKAPPPAAPPAPPAPPTTLPAQEARAFVQVGAFFSADFAAKFAAEWARKGYATRLVFGGGCHHVLVASGAGPGTITATPNRLLAHTLP